MRIVSMMILVIAVAGCGGGGGGDSSDGGGSAPERIVVAATTDAASPAGTLLRSDDGGATWKPSFASPHVLRSVAFADDRSGAAVGDGIALFTSDRGAHWSTSRAVAEETLVNVTFGSDAHGLATGEFLGPGEFQRTPLLLETTDAGAHWSPVDVPVSADEVATLGGACLTASGIAVVFGREGPVVLRRDATGWMDVSDLITGDDAGLGPLAGVVCPGGENVWLFGSSLRHSADGGLTWQDATGNLASASIYIEGLVFADAAHAWLVGARPVRVTANTTLSIDLRALRTNDGGVTWTDVALDQLVLGSWSNPATIGDGSRIVVGASGFSSAVGALVFSADDQRADRLALPPGFSALNAVAVVPPS